jgi:hypothetical protein
MTNYASGCVVILLVFFVSVFHDFIHHTIDLSKSRANRQTSCLSPASFGFQSFTFAGLITATCKNLQTLAPVMFSALALE